MAVVSTPIFPQSVLSPPIQITSGDTTTLKTIYTSDATDGNVLMAIYVTSTDTSARDLQFWISVNGGSDQLIGTLSIPANSGFTNSVPTVSVFHSTQFANMLVDVGGNKVFYLSPNTIVKAKVLANVTSAKVVYVTCQSGDF